MKGLLLFAILFVCLWMGFTYLTLPKDISQKAYQTFDLINQERSASGIALLEWDKELEALAIDHSRYMAHTGVFAHSNLPYAENIAMSGSSDPDELYGLWRGSPAHHNIYLDGAYKYGAIGIGYDYDYLQIGPYNILINYSRGYSTFLAR